MATGGARNGHCWSVPMPGHTCSLLPPHGTHAPATQVARLPKLQSVTGRPAARLAGCSCRRRRSRTAHRTEPRSMCGRRGCRIGKSTALLALRPAAAGGQGRKQAVLSAQLPHAAGRALPRTRRAFGLSTSAVVTRSTRAVRGAAALRLDTPSAELLGSADARRAGGARVSVHAAEVRARAAIPALADAGALGREAGPLPLQSPSRSERGLARVSAGSRGWRPLPARLAPGRRSRPRVGRHSGGGVAASGKPPGCLSA